MNSFWRDNGLTIVLVAMFLFSAAGMIWSGHAAYNDELQDHGKAAIGLLAYLESGDFLSALFENWESEFLQMSAYVMLTAMLFQRGSAEVAGSGRPRPPRRRNSGSNAEAQADCFVALLVFARDSVSLAFHSLVRFALVGEPVSSERGSSAARRGGSIRGLLSSRRTAVVQVLSELAIGVHVHRSPCRAVDLSPPQRLAGIKARRCIERRDGRITPVPRRR